MESKRTFNSVPDLSGLGKKFTVTDSMRKSIARAGELYSGFNATRFCPDARAFELTATTKLTK